jgi:hypothetical protein
MNQSPETTEKAAINPSLSAELQESHDALRNEMMSAKAVASDLESALAGKSKEMLHLKFLLEQSKAHLTHLQDGILAMRKERHKLANEAMRAKGLDIKLAVMTTENNRLKNELEGILDGLAQEDAQKTLRFDKRDHHIAELTLELMNVRQLLADERRKNHIPENTKQVPVPTFALKTSATDESFSTSTLEVIPTERTLGRRGL